MPVQIDQLTEASFFVQRLIGSDGIITHIHCSVAHAIMNLSVSTRMRVCVFSFAEYSSDSSIFLRKTISTRSRYHLPQELGCKPQVCAKNSQPYKGHHFTWDTFSRFGRELWAEGAECGACTETDAWGGGFLAYWDAVQCQCWEYVRQQGELGSSVSITAQVCTFMPKKISMYACMCVDNCM